MNGVIKRLALLAGLLLGFANARAANFPSTVSSDSNLYIAVNNCGTNLTANITSGATTIGASNTSCFPTVGYITIDSEAILCTGKTGTSFTGCTRGADGTTAASHTIGTAIEHYVIAAHHNLIKDEIIALENYFLTGDQVHITTSSTPDMVGLGTSTPTYHLDVWGNGTDGPLAVSTSATGSPKALSINTSGGTTIASATVSGNLIVGGTLDVTGAAAAATLNTGQGANELYDMDQNVQTSDAVTFATVNTGQGANELYDMNQNVQTSDSVTFAGITDSALTNGRFVLAGASGVLTDDGDFTHNGTTATFTGVSATSASVSGSITTGITASRAVQTSASSVLEASAVTSTELGYLSGATSNIQTQINALGSPPSAATQAEMEAASSNTVYTTPGRFHYHPAAPKAWVLFTSTGTLAILASYNVSSVTDNGVGNFTINFTNAFSSTNYYCRGGGERDGFAQGLVGNYRDGGTLTTSAYQMNFNDDGGVATDGPRNDVTCWGDQ